MSRNIKCQAEIGEKSWVVNFFAHERVSTLVAIWVGLCRSEARGSTKIIIKNELG